MDALLRQLLKTAGAYVAQDGTVIIPKASANLLRGLGIALGGYGAKDGSVFLTALRRLLT